MRDSLDSQETVTMPVRGVAPLPIMQCSPNCLQQHMIHSGAQMNNLPCIQEVVMMAGGHWQA